MSWRDILQPRAGAPAARERSDTPDLDADDVSGFCHALAAAREQFGHGVRNVTNTYGLGPRGPWIIGIIGRTEVSPHQLADFFTVGRSLITAELAKLSEVGFINQVRDPVDGRRTILSLTDAGRAAYERLASDLRAFLTERLAGYTAEEVRLCARMLTDFSHPGRG